MKKFSLVLAGGAAALAFATLMPAYGAVDADLSLIHI